MFSPMPICTVRIGACISPARPASAAPSPNTRVNSSLMLMPSAPIISRFEAPARISMPMRVRIDHDIKQRATASATTMIDRR